jgi:hypothetical protein
MNPRYPVFVPSKGRWDTRYTMKALDAIGVPYRAVVEPQEADRYVESGVQPAKILVLPHRDKGLVVTRNWIWDYALAMGTPRFWTFDDNIDGIYRLNRNLKTPIATGTVLRVIEDFADRYTNLPVAGMHYFMFASRKTACPPVKFNRRVYSNMLIETDARDPSGRPYRNEGFYNDDTDLCLRILKDGKCTALFNAFLIYKRTTMTVKGGMTSHYQPGLDGTTALEADGRYRMAKELKDKHPDVTTITRKWGRWQHHVDYSPFERNKPELRPGAQIQPGPNEYGMVLQHLENDRKWVTIPKHQNLVANPSRECAA